MSSSENNKYQMVTSGIRKEDRYFQWKILNFEIISKHKKLIETQKFEFIAGESIEQKMLWEISLSSHEEDLEKWIGIFCKIIDPFTFINQGWAELCVKIRTEDNPSLYKTPSGICEFSNGQGWGWEKLFPYKVNDTLPLIDGALVIDIHFTALSIRPTEFSKLGSNTALSTFGAISNCKNQLELLKDTFDDLNLSDVVIVTKDGKEFNCHKNILAAQCPVFATLFRSKMKEVTSGKILIGDICGSAMDIFLRYIYSGRLVKEWSDSKNVVEITYAAGKYQMNDLLEFLDESLGDVCTQATATKLLSLASKLGLEKAEMAILEKIKEMTICATSAEEFFAMTQM